MKTYLVVGDWPHDGHGVTEKVLIETNKTIQEVQNAYKASCKLTKISFTGIKRSRKENNKYSIYTNYEDNKLTEEVKTILLAFNCPQVYIDACDEDKYKAFIDLWFWFVKLSLPDLEYNYGLYN